MLVFIKKYTRFENTMQIEKILERVGKVKLQGGIFGKLTWAIIVVCICVTVLAYSTDNLYIVSCAIAAILVFAFLFFNKLLRFAENNPQAAIMDGAEFVMHEQIVHAAKGEGNLPMQPNTIDHPQPDIDQVLLEAEDIDTSKPIKDK